MKNYIAVLALFFATVINAQNFKKLGIDNTHGVPEGLTLNSTAPNINSTDIKGKIVDLYKLTKSGKVLIHFYRGGWCPLSKKFIDKKLDSLYALKSKYEKILMISPETKENAKETFSGKLKGDFIQVISDKDGSIMKKYKVYFKVDSEYDNKIKMGLFTSIKKHNGSSKDSYLPVPAIYVVNKKNKISFVYFNLDYGQSCSLRKL